MFDFEINIDKTKVMIFSGGKPHYFNYGDQNIEVVHEYLGFALTIMLNLM